MTLENLFTLLMLIFLQAVLGFDNLLYISLESKKVDPERQSYVRKVGIGIALVMRLILLFVLVKAIDSFQSPVFSIDIHKVIHGSFNIHSLIVLFGGIFIIYTAFKEIHHLISVDDLAHEGGSQKSSVGKAITWIVIMNLVFSFDSILSAIALTKVFWVMATAIVISSILMILLADNVANFLQKNRLYEVLGLFILLIVGIMLLSEGGHLAHLALFNYPIVPMAKSTFYFVIFVLVVVDVVQGRYQRKLIASGESGVGRG